LPANFSRHQAIGELKGRMHKLVLFNLAEITEIGIKFYGCARIFFSHRAMFNEIIAIVPA